MQTQGLTASTAAGCAGPRPVPVPHRTSASGHPRSAALPDRCTTRVAASDPRADAAANPNGSDSEQTSRADKPFIHPELLEGPLEQLPLGRWSQAAASHPAPPNQGTSGQPAAAPASSSVRQSSGKLWSGAPPTTAQESSLHHDEQRELQDSLRNSRFHVKGSARTPDVAASLLGSNSNGASVLPAKVYIIMYGKYEGMYTLKQRDGSGDDGVRDAVVCFERQQDAERYVTQLEAIMDKPLRATRLPSPDVMEFCRGHNYACCLNPAGALVMPPQHNAEVTDLERARNLQQGCFRVLDAEPQRGTST